MSSRFKPEPLKVGLVVFPGCMPAGLFATSDLLRAANERSGRELFRVDWVSVTRTPVPVWGGQSLQPTALLRHEHDAYLLPGIWATPRGVLEVLEQRALIEALRALPPTARLWSYCAGVVLLAAARKLDKRTATATWWMQPMLEPRFPRVRWSFSETLVVDGPVATASGPHGYLPLVEDLLHRTVEKSVRDDVVELLMVPQARSRHPLFRRLDMMNVEEELRPLLAHVLRTGAAQLDLRGAAARLGTSTRTLSRRVLQSSGISAGEWLRRVKLKQAADALTRTSKSVKQISFELGFSSEASFHRTFREVLGQTPIAFRQSFGERVGA
ncbi:MAG: helix-turn-helix domain-containing protein [Archangium sp.]|nr:helix-turn-helix domain-containing protein [Archangium sp.]